MERSQKFLHGMSTSMMLFLITLMMKSSQPTDPESGDTLSRSRQFSAMFTLIISNPSSSESSPCYREYRDRVRVRHPLLDHRQCDAAELHQVRGA